MCPLYCTKWQQTVQKLKQYYLSCLIEWLEQPIVLTLYSFVYTKGVYMCACVHVLFSNSILLFYFILILFLFLSFEYLIFIFIF